MSISVLVTIFTVIISAGISLISGIYFYGRFEGKVMTKLNAIDRCLNGNGQPGLEHRITRIEAQCQLCPDSVK